MKTLFLSEYLTSGALAGQELPDSLLREGWQMLRALSEDLLANQKFELATTIDHRMAERIDPRIQVTIVDQPHDEWRHFRRLARRCDATYIIAPELEGILTRRVQWLEAEASNVLMSTAKAVELASDKLRFAKWLEQLGIETPQTASFDLSQPHSFDQTYIVKPQLGAGATATAILRTRQD